ncbi:hypothetical protein [Fibrobacter sp.]|uniref:hypothetical protein n=1 Tax=Fibrobacter sp. TaxID=35828 RepID=UPI00388F54C1
MLGTVAGIITMDFSIFEAFPNAIISGIWQIGYCQHGTVVGNEFTPLNNIDVVIDEGSSSSINSIPEALRSDLLIYAYPCQMPTLDTTALVSSYMLYNSETNKYYEIVDAGIGKNQHTGLVEHIELKVVQTEVVNG